MVDIAIFGQPVSSLKVTVLQKERARERKQYLAVGHVCISVHLHMRALGTKGWSAKQA